MLLDIKICTYFKASLKGQAALGGIALNKSTFVSAIANTVNNTLEIRPWGKTGQQH
jgi:hypothetical protein